MEKLKSLLWRGQPKPEIKEEYVVPEFEESDEEDNISWLDDPIYYNSSVSKYKVQARIFVNNIRKWAFNRKVDQPHVNKISKDLLNMETPHLQDAFKIAQGKDGK